MTADPAPVIVITATAAGFDVDVATAPDWSRSFDTHKDAYGWALGVRLATRWAIRDVTEQEGAK